MIVGFFRLVAGATGLARLSRAARRQRPVRPSHAPGPPISVVIPARDEVDRLGPLLDALVGAPDVAEVLVVDDESSDGTADLASRSGATVIAGLPLPARWVGKAWALQQGLDAAGCDWVVCLDADTRPDPVLPRALVARATADGLDLLTVAGRFECPTVALGWLHPALLTTLLYRGAPPGAVDPGPPHRRMGNGQCMAVHRPTLTRLGGFAAVAHQTVEDVALVRALAAAGFAVDFLDAASLLRVRMFESFGDAWRGWSRSLSLPDVDGWLRRTVDLAVVSMAQAAPLARIAARRADPLDLVLLAARLGTLVGTAQAYDRRGGAYWLSPLADPIAVLALARGLVMRRQRWRGRVYGPWRNAAR